MENQDYKILPFDLKVALEHPDWVYTQYGEPVRILCTDSCCHTVFPILCLVTSICTMPKWEQVFHFNMKGIPYKSTANGGKGGESDDKREYLELRKPITKVKRYIVSYINQWSHLREVRAKVYDTKEKAQRRADKISVANDPVVHEIEIEE